MLILSCLFLSIGLIYSQNITVSGVVVDDAGIEVVGASVVVKGTTTGVGTDIDGKFSLSAPSNSTLVFSLVGMKKKEMKAAPSMKVVMENDEALLEEVIVVAYGTVKKGAFTGSAAVVDNDIIARTPVTSFEKALQGASAGVQVSSLSGQPGAATTVRIRGVGSINGDSSPLYVIDGVPISSSSNSSGRIGKDSDFSQVADTYNPLATLNSEDIESVTVLKDASAASLYGSRAANGVILITTKKGSEGKATVNFKSSFGFSKRIDNGYDFMSAAEIYKHYWNGAVYKSQTNPKDPSYGKTAAEIAEAANADVLAAFLHNPYNVKNPIGADGELVNGAKLMYDTDWMDAVYRTGTSQQYDFSVSGGTKDTQYYVSLGYMKNKGVVIESMLDRYSGRINLTTKANKWMKVGANSTFSLSNQTTPSSDGGGSSAIVGSMAMANTIPMYDLDADFNKQYDPITGEVLYNYKNPISPNMNGVALASKDKYKTRTYRALISPWIEVTPMEGVSWKTNFAYDYNNLDEMQWYNKDYGNAASIDGRLYKYAIWNNTATMSSQLSYDFKFLENHNLNIMAGLEFTNNTHKRLLSHASHFPVFDLIEIGAGGVPEKGSSVTNKENLNSYFGRINYDYKEKYYLSLSARRDGSSRFGKDNKYGTFWSIGGNWRITSEKFMEDTKDWLHDLKLRASFGTAGSKDGIGRYDSLGLYASSNYQSIPGVYHYQMANPTLGWEKSNNMNVGIDFNFWGRLYGSIEYYDKRSTDLLLDRPLALSTGFSSRTVNEGKLKNSGIELSLTSVNLQKADLLWETTLNLAHSSNKIYDYPDNRTINTYTIWTDGYSMYEFYMQDWAGVDPETGAPLWYKDIEDADGNVVGKETTSTYSDATKYKLGSSLPKVMGSLSNNLEYKGFDLSFLITYQFGGKVYDSYEEFLLNDGAKVGNQMIREALDSWSPENPNASNPLFVKANASKSNSISSRFLHKSDFFKLKNISLGYTLPKKYARSMFLESVRLFATVENVAIWKLDADFKGSDPELGGISGRLDGRGTVLLPRTYLFGFSINL